MPYVNLDMRREPAVNLSFIPLTNRKDQTKWAGKENINASVVDPVFQKEREIGKIVNNVYLMTQAEMTAMTNETTLLSQKIQSMEDHLDERLCAFFRQLVDCYDKPYIFEQGKIEDQLESSKTLTWICENIRGTMSFESAHYGTLPSLIAYPRSEYETWQKNPSSAKPRGHVFGKYSDTYLFNNACAGHLKIINTADSLIDWQGDSNTIVRPFALNLLNASAKKDIDPLNGMNLFIAKLSLTVDQLLTRSTDPSLQLIFRTYKQHLAFIRAMVDQDSHNFFTNLLGIKINRTDPLAQKLREIIYPHRFKTLQTAGEYQNQIAARIQHAKTQILAGQKKPNLFDRAFKACVILSAARYSEKMSKIFQRHFSMNISQATQAWNASFSPARNKCATAVATNEINALFSDVNKLVHNQSIDISTLRATLLRQLRQLHRWSQTTLANKVNQLSPTENFYQQKVSRLELGEKKITDSIAQLFSQVFGVHKSIFITELAPYAIEV